MLTLSESFTLIRDADGQVVRQIKEINGRPEDKMATVSTT